MKQILFNSIVILLLFGSRMTILAQPAAPTSVTATPTTITATGATLNGSITANNASTVVTFDYGTTTNYGSSVTADQSPVTGTTATSVSFSLSGLLPNTTYHFRVNGVNSAGTTNGSDQSFTTTLLYSGGTGTSENPYQIATLTDLRYLSEHSDDWTNYFIQTADIDASSTSTWNGGAGFSPIGNYSNSFSGNYNGQNYTINGLTINNPGTDYVGLFGYYVTSWTSHTISNIGLTNVSIIGGNYVGGLVGWNNTGIITDTYTTGTVKGNSVVGGLIGMNNFGSISNSFSNANTEGTGNVGNVGGLLGQTWGGSISNSYATGSVTGTDLVAGLIGYFGGYASLLNSYAVGSVTGSTNVGGLIGFKESGTIITNSFWDTQTTGQTISADGNGETTAQMKTQTTFTGWDFMFETANGTNDYWGINALDNGGYPFLNWQGFISIPATQASALVFSSVQATQMAIGWTNGTGLSRAVFVKADNTGTTTPVDNTTYTANTTFSNGTQIGSTGWYCIYNGTGTSVTVTGLSLGTNYIAEVFDYNGAAGSEKYNTATAKDNPKSQTTAVVPTATTSTATTITATGAMLNGSITANNANTVVTFDYGTTTDYGSSVTADQSPVTGTTATSVSFSLSGLLPNTTYHFRVNGVNSVGTTNGTDLTFTTTAVVPTATTSAATTITTTGATLNGSITANNTSTVVTFDYGTTTDYGSSVTADQSPVTGTTATSVSFSLSGLLPNTTYHFRVNGVNSVGASNGSDETFTTSTITGFDNADISKLSLYPNPAENGFTIDLGDKTTFVTIHDLRGILLLRQEVTGKRYIDITSLKQGVYMLNADGLTTKLIKK